MLTSESDRRTVEAAEFYEHNYVALTILLLRPGMRVLLGDKQNRVCRFCGLERPTVSFRSRAHAIPKLLGNKSLFTYYECDACNQFFGHGIENDLGNWTMPSRTFSRISGSKGVPTIKRGGSKSAWRIEYRSTGFHLTQYEDDPFFILDEEKKQVRFELRRDPYTPVAVLKAFVRIGLTLMPENELPHFLEAMSWVRNPNHGNSPIRELPTISTFIPGPMPNDVIFCTLMGRRPSIANVPYAFLVLGFGNHVYQVFLPCPKKDAAIQGRKLEFPAFPTPSGVSGGKYGSPRVSQLNLCGTERVKGETAPIVLGFDAMEVVGEE